MKVNFTKQQLIKFCSIYFLLFLFLPPWGLEEMLGDSFVFPLFRALCCTISFLLYIWREKISIFSIVVSFFGVWLCICTFIKNGNLIGALYGQTIVVISGCFFFEYEMRSNTITFLECLYKYCFIMVLMNFICILIFPQGMYVDTRGYKDCNYLLGNYNSFILTILPGICAGYHLIKENKNTKKNYIAYWTLVLLTYIIKRSITSIIGITIIGSFIILFNNHLSQVFFNAFTYVVGGIGLGYFVVFRRTEHFISIITKLTGKSITFSGRTPIWDKMIPLWEKAKWTGYGVQNKTELIEWIQSSAAGHAHNLLLQILFQSGLIGTGIWAVIVGIIIYNISRTSYDKTARVYGCAFFALLVMSSMDFYGYAVILIFLTLINAGCHNILDAKNSKVRV